MPIEATTRPPRSRPSVDVMVVGAGIVLSMALLAGAGIVAPGTDTGHARFHGSTALMALLVAAGILWVRPSRTLANRAPVVGLVALAVAMLVESVGALGFGPDGYGRVNDLVVLHDLGLLLTPLAMIVMVVALAISAGAVIWRRAAGSNAARATAVLVGLVVVAMGLFLIATLTGMTPFLG